MITFYLTGAMKKTFYIILISLCLYIDEGRGVPSTIYEFDNIQAVKYGLAYPYKIHVEAGHSVIAEMLKTLENQERCILRTPDFIDVDLGDGNNEKYEKWGEGCAVRIKNITKFDHGRWQLISMKDDKSLQGMFSIIIEDESKIHLGDNIDYIDGQPVSEISFLRTNSQYCVLRHPKHQDVIVKGDCVLQSSGVSRIMQGEWTLGVGMAGSVDEKIFQKQFTVRAEDLDSGYEHDLQNNKVHLHCNLKNSYKTIDFCRFERVEDKEAFNMNDGLGKGRYSYYGRGIYKKDCGLTISNPESRDFASWRCTVGVMANNGKDFTPLQRAIMVYPPTNRIIPATEEDPIVVIAVAGKPLEVTCKAKTTIIYCSFLHPNGTIIAPNKTNHQYTFETHSYDIGVCKLKLNETEVSDSGEWTCYMGPKDPGLEIQEKFHVRIGGGLVATYNDMKVYKDTNVTLKCVTAGGYHELHHCRFLPPNGQGFNIDEKITEKNAILGAYYYPKSTSSMLTGDCAVTIIHVNQHQFGEWKCMAMLTTEDTEYMDTIMLAERADYYPLSTASVTGIIIGVAVVLVMMVFVVWKRRSLPGLFRRGHTGGQEGEGGEREVGGQPRTSAESGESIMEMSINPSQRPAYGTAPGLARA